MEINHRSKIMRETLAFVAAYVIASALPATAAAQGGRDGGHPLGTAQDGKVSQSLAIDHQLATRLLAADWRVVLASLDRTPVADLTPPQRYIKGHACLAV